MHIYSVEQQHYNYVTLTNNMYLGRRVQTFREEKEPAEDGERDADGGEVALQVRGGSGRDGGEHDAYSVHCRRQAHDEVHGPPTRRVQRQGPVHRHLNTAVHDVSQPVVECHRHARYSATGSGTCPPQPEHSGA